MKKLIQNLPLFTMLFVLAAGLLFGQPSAFAEEQSLKPDTQQQSVDTEIQSPHEVCMDRTLRMRGHYKEYLDRMWQGLKDNTLIPRCGSELCLQSQQIHLQVPPGPLFSKMAQPSKSGDQYIAQRPVYRPLYARCSGAPNLANVGPPTPLPGEFCPPTPSYVLDYANKDCKGQGGAVCVGGDPNMPCYVQPQLPPNPDPSTYNKTSGGGDAGGGASQQGSENKDSDDGRPGCTFGISKEGDQALWEYELTTFGVGPISDTQYQMIERENNQRFLELLFCPERWNWTAQAATCMQQQQMSDGMANTADQAYNTSLNCISEYLINVANESAAQPCNGNPPEKTVPQAIYMVQQMYKQVFLPMAILLLLPGACMTQMKSMVQFGVLHTQDDTNDTASPFQGLIRSMVAIFLIPATQLIVSYMIDVGNSMMYEVKNHVDFNTLREYGNEQQFGCAVKQSINWMKPSPRNKQADKNSIEGKAYNGAEQNAVAEQQANISKQVQLMYNFFNYAMSTGLIVLTQFQLVMMCYLFLCGPVAAALYAWPNINKSSTGPGLFNKIFANWLDAVVVLSLWRFWWMVVLATLCTYIQWCKEMGWYDPHSEWELMVFTSFQVLLMLAPFQPFNFNPKPFVEQVEKKAKEQTSGAQGPAGDKQGGGTGSSTQTPATNTSQTSNTVTPASTTGSTQSGGSMGSTSSSGGSSSSSGGSSSSSSGSSGGSSRTSGPISLSRSGSSGASSSRRTTPTSNQPSGNQQPPPQAKPNNGPQNNGPPNNGPPNNGPPRSRRGRDDD